MPLPNVAPVAEAMKVEPAFPEDGVKEAVPPVGVPVHATLE